MRHLVLLLLLLLILPAACKRAPAPAPGAAVAQAPADAPTVADAVAFAATQPRYLQPVPHSEVPAGLANVRASTCGGCHQEIYAEWRISTHARAWLDDPQFLEELEKSKKQGVAWMCMNCHTPYADQLPELVAGYTDGDKSRPILVPNPDFDAAMQADAIGCATCHVRDGAVLGPFGDTNAPHATKKAEDLVTVEVCTQCHQAAAYFKELNLACTFDTGDEFTRGPYDDEGKTCQSCHMPEVTRPLMVGFPERPTRRHWFGGSLIPKKPEFEAELAPLRDVYGDGLDVAWTALPEALTPGTPVALTATYTNAHAGHLLPTGDPERFILVTAVATAADGAELARAEHRIGAVYTWWPEVKKESDNRLEPRESRTLELAFTPPETGSVTVQLTASKWRLSQENLDYHDLADRSVAGRTFFDATQTLPIRSP